MDHKTADWRSMSPAEIAGAYPVVKTALDNPNLNIVQPKYDGWFSIGVFESGYFTAYSKGGIQLAQYNLNQSIASDWYAILAGEFLGRTNWANNHPDCTKFAVLDFIQLNAHNMMQVDYGSRMVMLRRMLFDNSSLLDWPLVWIRSLPVHEADWMWKTYVEEQGFEGLVYRDDTRTDVMIAKRKRRHTIDYVCTAIHPGGSKPGMMGSITGSVWRDEKLVPVCSVGGGFTDEQRFYIWEHRDTLLGKAFEAYGMGLNGDTLRHPNFLRWRDDKLPEDCTSHQL